MSEAGVSAPTSQWHWRFLKFSRQLWVRTSFFAFMAVATALLALAVKPYLPSGIGTGMGAESVDSLLNILASSMLAVTTFSLGIVLSAFGSAASHVTPRAARLLMEDTATQNALATFLGAFLFSIVGIIALKAGVYGENGRLVLFVVTIAVIVVIVVTFIRWIEILRTFGRMGDTISRVEKATRESFAARLASPCLGGNPLLEAIPDDAVPLMSSRTGYVEHLDMGRLSGCAETHDTDIYLAALPGSFVHLSAPLAWVRSRGNLELPAEEIEAAFTIENHRTFEQDPRFGITVLAEIASRALSPAVNDPGTAIDVIGRGVRLLSGWTEKGDAESTYPRLWVKPIRAAEVFEDFFRPISRDGASLVEVQIRLQKALLALAQCGVTGFPEAARKQSREALERAEAALVVESDREILRELSEKVLAIPDSHPAPDPGI
ncbi:MAG: DUF2254 domain-containing protein [Verrucomicrobiae bacterium]|nr:DUF2254 domain-containing protein [Verrucomicrobiae bacterium]